MILSSVTSKPSLGSVKFQKISDGLEKAFLSDMLKYAGPKPLEGGFGGGIGEEQFSSLMTETYADTLARRLDLGILGKIGAEK